MLDSLCIKFDCLSRLHDVFKVETASPQPDHTKRVPAFANGYSMQAAIATLIDEGGESKGFVNIRNGFHSGPVIAICRGLEECNVHYDR